MVNPQGRLNKAIGYLATHEIYKGIGAMEKVAGKVKEPHFQAFPFVWAVSHSMDMPSCKRKKIICSIEILCVSL